MNRRRLALAALAGGAAAYVYAWFAQHGHVCSRCGELAGHLSLRCDSYIDEGCPNCDGGGGGAPPMSRANPAGGPGGLALTWIAPARKRRREAVG